MTVLSIDEWLEAQRAAQERHDRRNHQDVTCLGERGRLVHYALHHGKYVGRLARAQDDLAVRRTVTDCVLVCLSAANVLGQGLLGTTVPAASGGIVLLREIADATGRFAGAVTATGPLPPESIEVATLANADLLGWMMSLAAYVRHDVRTALPLRRQFLRERAFFVTDDVFAEGI